MQDDHSWETFTSSFKEYVDETPHIQIVSREDIDTTTAPNAGRTSWGIGRSLILQSTTDASAFETLFNNLPPVLHSVLFVSPVVLESGEVVIETTIMRDWVNYTSSGDGVASINFAYHPTMERKEAELEKTVSNLEYYNGTILDWIGSADVQITSISKTRITASISKDLLSARFENDSIFLPQQSQMWLFLSGVSGETENSVEIYFERPSADYLVTGEHESHPEKIGTAGTIRGFLTHIQYVCPNCGEQSMVGHRFTGALSLYCTNCWETQFASRDEVDTYLDKSNLSIEQASREIPNQLTKNTNNTTVDLNPVFKYDSTKTKYKYNADEFTIYLEFLDPDQSSTDTDDSIIAHMYTGAIHFSFPVPDSDIVRRKHFDKPLLCQLCGSYINGDERFIDGHNRLGIALSPDQLYQPGNETKICFDCFKSIQPYIERALTMHKTRVLTHTI